VVKVSVVLPEQFPECSLIELEAESFDHLIDFIESKSSIPKKYFTLSDNKGKAINGAEFSKFEIASEKRITLQLSLNRVIRVNLLNE
jgi:hypothetical protein